MNGTASACCGSGRVNVDGGVSTGFFPVRTLMCRMRHISGVAPNLSGVNDDGLVHSRRRKQTASGAPLFIGVLSERQSIEYYELSNEAGGADSHRLAGFPRGAVNFGGRR